MGRPYYLHKRAGFWYAELADQETGIKLTARSTGTQNRDEAILKIISFALRLCRSFHSFPKIVPVRMFSGWKSEYRKKAPKKGALSLIYFAVFFFAVVVFLAAGFFAAVFLAAVFFTVVFLVTGIVSS